MTFLDTTVKTFILDSIELDDDEQPITTLEEKLNYLKQRTDSEIHGDVTVKKIDDWLRGIALNIPYWNDDILEHAVVWGSLSNDATDRQKEKITDNYWNFMANKVNQLITGYRVPKNY